MNDNPTAVSADEWLAITAGYARHVERERDQPRSLAAELLGHIEDTVPLRLLPCRP
jgi:hypothetical protein